MESARRLSDDDFELFCQKVGVGKELWARSGQQEITQVAQSQESILNRSAAHQELP
jgi:hypothetical protein